MTIPAPLAWALALLLAGPVLAQPTSPPPIAFDTHVAPPFTRLLTFHF